jgi:predicted  nucleic acid-binding Zn-ribbon protein
VKTLEDQVLERMLEADELTAAVKKMDAALAAEQKAVEADRRALAAEIAALTTSLDRIAADRAAIVSKIDRQVLATFELVASRRGGLGIAEARDGHCTICHVRLRPQVFNTVRRNDSIIQGDSCQRILYFVPSAASEPLTGATAQPQPGQ